MARSILVDLVLVLGLARLGQTTLAGSQSFVFDFTDDMEGWSSYRGSWRWTDRARLNNTLPAASSDDGFAVMDAPNSSDELYTPFVSAPKGATVVFSFFLRSEWEGSNTLSVDLIEQGKDPTMFLDLTPYSSPFARSWVTVTGEIPPMENEVLLAVFCYNGKVAPVGSLMYGCAIDQIQIDIHGEETTAAPTEAPQTTTDALLTTAAPTEAPETTAAPTEAPETTAAPTEAPETTAAPTEAPETTAAPTEAPETTAAPTEAPTTEGPPGPLIFDFQSSVQGWTLSEMNGGAWRRVTFDHENHFVTAPPEGPKVLQVFPSHIFAGTVLAQSPLLEAVDETVRVLITFWMDGTNDFPAQLKVRKRTDFSTFDVNPIMNLDPFGDQENHKWITYSTYLTRMVVGQTFTLNLEGSLGSNLNNSVAVNKIVVEGVKVIQTDLTNLMDFENGLFGWSTGNMDGGRWVLQPWSDLDHLLNVPKPSDGENFLFVERFDIHSGVISLESPAFPIQAGERKKVHIKFWIRGSVIYPAALRLRKKSVNGAYDDLPFLNLAGYGDIDNPDWIYLDKEYYIPIDETEEAFQIVIEADLGSDSANLVALDDLTIVTEYYTGRD
ncbi:uncharacterized protein LOC122257679 isoform X2 [Penaeus japonicus]|uniref:uncharacterized protein LOC122257679 isoform X2 n=1 Tax=Penaeus japonicus TaxID=27405 RepID=UPI001C70CF58|nr:uncharacterized protein LOC122257679 isoform X2 [Penaeus japonicus]